MHSDGVARSDGISSFEIVWSIFTQHDTHDTYYCVSIPSERRPDLVQLSGRWGYSVAYNTAHAKQGKHEIK